MDHPIGFRHRPRVEARHTEMVRLRQAGMFQKEIGAHFGLDHSTVNHHLKGWCRCDAEPFKGPFPYWLRTLKALRAYGPIRCHALARILSLDREGTRKQLMLMAKEGLAVRDGNLWRALAPTESAESANGRSPIRRPSTDWSA